MTVKEVAEHLDLHWETVKKDISEVSFSKYHKYLTLVLDFKTGRVIWFKKGCKVDTLNVFFKKMPQTKLNQIKAIAMDMWDHFIKSVREHCPQALIIFNKYHFIANYNRDVIDEIR